MIPIARTRILFIVTLLFTLSGCAANETLLNLIDFNDIEPAEEIVLLDDELTPAPSAELSLEPLEEETCIRQELDALRQTGSWTEKDVSADTEVNKYDFPIVMNKQVKTYIDLFQDTQRKHFQRWLSRSTKYLPLILQELEKAGLPLDLAYLAMIESGFNQRAHSRAGAVGLWQFMSGTGRDYNLSVDRYVDERRNAEKATKAAVTYLAELYKQFGDWHLAVAAYNAGPGKIRYGLDKYKVETFWELAQNSYLHLETKRYVPKLIAAIIVAKDPEKYGFSNIQCEPPFEYDTLEVGPGLSLDALALLSETTKKQIMLLNQELKTERTPLNQSEYLAKIPKGTYTVAKANLSRLRSVVRTSYKTHIIAGNETLTAICNKYSINKKTLLKVNDLRTATLVKGQRLRIPYSVVDYKLLPKQSGSLALDKSDNPILHKVQRGETISKIAKKYAVPPEMIVAWNGLQSVNKIRAGQQLALYIVNENVALEDIAATAQPEEVIAESLPEKQTAFNNIVLADAKKKRVDLEDEELFNWYHVKVGDTLWNISRRFNTSPKDIKAWNNLKTNLIRPGYKLKLKDV